MILNKLMSLLGRATLPCLFKTTRRTNGTRCQETVRKTSLKERDGSTTMVLTHLLTKVKMMIRPTSSSQLLVAVLSLIVELYEE